MVISCSTCLKEEKEYTWVKYLIYAALSQFKSYRNLAVFLAKSVFPKFRVHNKNVVFLVWAPDDPSVQCSGLPLQVWLCSKVVPPLFLGSAEAPL